MDGVPRPLSAFSLSSPLIHDFSGLAFGGSGICQKSVVQECLVSLVVCRVLETWKAVEPRILFKVIGFTDVCYTLFQLLI